MTGKKKLVTGKTIFQQGIDLSLQVRNSLVRRFNRPLQDYFISDQ